MKESKFKMTKWKIVLIVVACILIPCLLFFTIVTTMASTFRQDNLRLVKAFTPLDQVNLKWPSESEEDGSWTFVSDEPLKVLQISDIQLGGGWLTKEADAKALNAVAAMVIAEEPDLVIVTGDMSYCNPRVGASLNNLETLRLICRLFETLQVCYTFTFGNQDSERQCLYSREYIADFLDGKQFHYCIFNRGPEDISGIGNQVIKVKDTNGFINQAIICLDSNSYQDNKIGTAYNAKETSNYGYVKEDQLTWYKEQIAAINTYNKEKNPDYPIVNSSIFMHLPPYEMRLAYEEFKDNKYQDTENVKFLGGEIGEKGKVVNSSNIDTNFIETLIEVNSTSSVYFGHDTLNTFALEYKGIKLEYSGSVDYISRKDISKFGRQRGCKVIMLNPDGTSESKFENYYQEKYNTIHGKEQADLENSYWEKVNK